nr:hypothetical protein [Tanacetum cinerariifolium]
YISAPTSSPPLQLPSASRREDRPEVTLPPRKKLGIALGPVYEVGKSSSAAAARPAGDLKADYGFVAIMDREIRRDPEEGVGYGITDSWDEILETLQGAPDEEDDEMDVEADEEEEEEHPAPADSVVVAPTAADQAPSAEETEPFETDESAATPPPHTAYHTTTRISIPAPVPMPA